MRTRFRFSICLIAFLFGASTIRAEVAPNPLFCDNAVLQQGMQVPVWGTARPGERVTVEFAGQTVATKADSTGNWLVRLKTLKAGGPYTLTISGKNKIVCTNVLVGEVWICSGQSNMERQLGLRNGQKPIADWETEVINAKYPAIRQFYVPQVKSFTPLQTARGSWAVCSPETVTNFTAVGYFFGRDLYRARHVPIGLIHSSWGGTAAEAWVSEVTISQLPDFASALAQLKQLVANPAEARRATRALQDAWYAKVDPGSKSSAAWSAADLDTSSWKTMKLPAFWEEVGYPNFDGVFWFRRAFDLPETWDGTDVELHLGAIDDNDTTWVNGSEVGATIGWNVPRVYRIPGSSLNRSNNVIAVRVLDTGAGGGLWGGDDPMRMIVTTGQKLSIPLTGTWLCQRSVSLLDVGWPPTDYSQSPSAPDVLYNGMITPLVPYAIRGVIWYQGESNVGRERQYRTLFPALIADWRQTWSEGEFPFLFVQLAPYKGNTPELREAQLLTVQHTTNTAMAVTVDCGDADDVHPAHKQPVGARLALAARALAYGEKIEYSGPIFESMTVTGSVAVLRFTHIGGGLVAKDGPLRGFTIAGTDKVFHPAEAQIRGKTIVVHSAVVTKPVAVRYGWANVPDANLFNHAGLPASPVRTDVN